SVFANVRHGDVGVRQRVLRRSPGAKTWNPRLGIIGNIGLVGRKMHLKIIPVPGCKGNAKISSGGLRTGLVSGVGFSAESI
ncbi:MAG: hypothetical protein J4N70_05195, partial [Chloroflexi bacterium]|nr:hypothetical protein [Chloroflexota bacterium]